MPLRWRWLLSFFLFVKKMTIQLDVIGVDLMPEVVKLAQSNAEKNSAQGAMFTELLV